MHMPCGFGLVGFGRLTGVLRSVCSTSLQSCRFAPSTARPIGIPLASVSTIRLVQSFVRSVGLGPVFFPAKRRLRRRTVHRYPAPVEAFEFVVTKKPAFPELEEHVGIDPLAKTAIGR